MSLEAKIRAILQEVKKDDSSTEKVLDEKFTVKIDGDEGDGKKDKKDDKDSDEDDSDGDDSDGDEGDTDVSKDSGKKDKAEVKENTLIPGTPNKMGKTAKETLTDASDETSGAAKTSKMTSAYKKGTKQEKLPETSGSGSSDEKATSETGKIKAAYKTSEMPKLKAEAINALFNGETLTEEFKVKAEAIFEAAVEQVAEAKVLALQEEYQLQLTEAVEEAKGELVEQIDGYLDYVVEQWMQDNAVALESGIKVEMVSSFMEKMKDVFTEHYIDVPDSKLDVVEEQANLISEMEEELVILREEIEHANTEAQILTCEATITEYSIGLTAIEAEKLYSLAENIEFVTKEEFASKVSALKESYFRKSKIQDTPITAQVPAPRESITEQVVHPDVAAVLKVLSDKNNQKLIRSSN